MRNLAEMKATLGEDTKDLRLNLDSVLKGGVLDLPATYTVALTSALFLRDRELAGAILEAGAEHLTPAAVEDARASAAIMAMNTVYYRFRHMIGKESYGSRPAGLRMNRMIRPATSKATFELCSMACAVLAGCEMCVKSHEQSLLKEGISEEQVHEAVRIAAVVNGFLVATFAAPVGAAASA